ncbi:hypothetical protein [Metabacillus fastidiosus]|nr:hypothetical protein [Metabacillus fastidiosus]MEC2077797.1 hypothetical protein [Metabacillus fastidiosus]
MRNKNLMGSVYFIPNALSRIPKQPPTVNKDSISADFNLSDAFLNAYRK